MRPALAHGDVLLVSGVEEGEELGRGDVVVVREPAGREGEYLKRVVGLPGEEVRTVDGLLFVDGTHTHEPYLGGLPSSVGLGETAWTAGRVGVLGAGRQPGAQHRQPPLRAGRALRYNRKGVAALLAPVALRAGQLR